MKPVKKIFLVLVPAILCLATLLSAGCHVYKFTETGTIPPEIKTVKLVQFENKARYINPQLTQRLSDRLRQKIVSQTRLSPTSSDTANWEISGFISDYTFSTSAISDQRVATNRLTVSMHITLNDRKSDKISDYDVSRSFEFPGNLSFQQAEARLGDEMVRTLTDEIFNKLFSNW
jgi:outer membrane lipopolysaccharide assembly protein LptE/RlpB